MSLRHYAVGLLERAGLLDTDDDDDGDAASYGTPKTKSSLVEVDADSVVVQANSVVRRCKLEPPRLESVVRFQNFNLMKRKLAFNLKPGFSELAPPYTAVVPVVVRTAIGGVEAERRLVVKHVVGAEVQARPRLESASFSKVQP